MTTASPSIVHAEIVKPAALQIGSLLSFMLAKLPDVLMCAAAIALTGIITLYSVLSLPGVIVPLPGPVMLNEIAQFALFGFAFTLLVTLHKLFDGDMGFIIAGSFVMGMVVSFGISFSVFALPMPLVLAFCTALAIAGWLMFLPVFAVNMIDKIYADQWVKRQRVTVKQEGRFVVTTFTSEQRDAMGFVDEWVVEDTCEGKYYEAESEYAAYRLVSGILGAERRAARKAKAAA